MIAEKLQLTTVQAPDDDQGFLDSSGKWLSRKAALLNAREHNQLNDRPIIGGRLYSENLW